tara:strand:+ start:109 stop:219 length:111 start_codon:yes stop_codon:yes gene_type:complete
VVMLRRVKNPGLFADSMLLNQLSIPVYHLYLAKERQ